MFCLYIEGSSEWCCNFVTQNGLNIYTSLINSFETNIDILIKSTGLIVISLYYMNRFKSPFLVWFQFSFTGNFFKFFKVQTFRDSTNTSNFIQSSNYEFNKVNYLICLYFLASLKIFIYLCRSQLYHSDVKLSFLAVGIFVNLLGMLNIFFLEFKT